MSNNIWFCEHGGCDIRFEAPYQEFLDGRCFCPKHSLRTLAESSKPTGIDATLEERGARYGEFIGQAVVTQNIKDAMRFGRNWHVLDKDMKEALDMVATKIARILNGDPSYHDSWHDIIGYTKLVADRLEKK